jgi:hypothetical protein
MNHRDVRPSGGESDHLASLQRRGSEDRGDGCRDWDFLSVAGVGVAAGAVGLSVACQSPTAQQAVSLQAPQGERLLLRGGVLTLDPGVGDFDVADVLIEGSRIAAVGPNLDASAEVVGASGTIVMPGFVDTHRDTHRHMWQGSLRNILPNGLLSDYGRDIRGAARASYRPEDAHIGDLVSALGAIDAGVTCVLDWSHIGNSPEHTDAVIEGLRESGIRAVYAYGGGTGGSASPRPNRHNSFEFRSHEVVAGEGGHIRPIEHASERENVAGPLIVTAAILADALDVGHSAIGPVSVN